MANNFSFSNGTNSPLPLGEGLGANFFQFLKAAAVSTENVIDMMKLTKRQIEVTMFAAGVGNLTILKDTFLH